MNDEVRRREPVGGEGRPPRRRPPRTAAKRGRDAVRSAPPGSGRPGQQGRAADHEDVLTASAGTGPLGASARTRSTLPRQRGVEAVLAQHLHEVVARELRGLSARPSPRRRRRLRPGGASRNSAVGSVNSASFTRQASASISRRQSRISSRSASSSSAIPMRRHDVVEHPAVDGVAPAAAAPAWRAPPHAPARAARPISRTRATCIVPPPMSTTRTLRVGGEAEPVAEGGGERLVDEAQTAHAERAQDLLEMRAVALRRRPPAP